MGRDKVKRILSVALAVVLIGVFPVSALAEQLILNSGAGSAGTNWDWDGSTLNLNGIEFNGMSTYDGIKLPAGAVIKLAPGSVNSVSSTIYGVGKLTVLGDGSGTLNVGNTANAPFFALYSNGPMDITDCNVQSQGNLIGIGTINGELRITNSRINAFGNFAIFSDFQVLIDSSVSPRYGVQLINSTIKAKGYSSISGSSIDMTDCGIDDPSGGFAGSFAPYGNAILLAVEEPAGYVSIIPKSATPSAPVETQYTITYDLNGGGGPVPVDTKQYSTGDRVMLDKGKGLTRPGYKFAGWELSDGTPVRRHIVIGESNVTLFAAWRLWNKK
jgi:uncharacterized repeat protein (TIGR02543 family)